MRSAKFFNPLYFELPNQQVEQCTRVARELDRGVASDKEARDIYKIGVQYKSVDETLAKLGMAPNRVKGQLFAEEAPRANKYQHIATIKNKRDS